jgi:hypothetical protein
VASGSAEGNEHTKSQNGDVSGTGGEDSKKAAPGGEPGLLWLQFCKRGGTLASDGNGSGEMGLGNNARNNTLEAEGEEREGGREMVRVGRGQGRGRGRGRGRKGWRAGEESL